MFLRFSSVASCSKSITCPFEVYDTILDCTFVIICSLYNDIVWFSAVFVVAVINPFLSLIIRTTTAAIITSTIIMTIKAISVIPFSFLLGLNFIMALFSFRLVFLCMCLC